MRLAPHSRLAIAFASLVCACGGGGGGGGGGSDDSQGLAPLVPPQTLVEVVPPVDSLQGVLPLRFSAPGRGLLFGDDSVTIAFDEAGVLRRAFGLSETALVQSEVLSGGVQYMTVFDFAGPEGDLLVRFDATASTQSTWTLPAPSYLVPDGDGRAYLAISLAFPGATAQPGIGLDSISRLSSDGTLAWTVEAKQPINFVDIQNDGLLVSLSTSILAQGWFPDDVLAHIGRDGGVPWQLDFDGGESGATMQGAWATGNGGAWVPWLAGGPFAQAGVGESGVCHVTPSGVVRTYAYPVLDEALVEYEPAYHDEGGLARGISPDRTAFLARGSAGGVFHVRPVGEDLDVDRVEFVGEECTELQARQEPESGEILAVVDTTLGRHLVRWRKDGSVRWAKSIGNFSGLGEWRGLPSGGALVVLGPPIGAQQGVVSCVASIGADGATQWVRDAFGLSPIGEHRTLALADGGAVLWWGRRILFVGAQGQFLGQRILTAEAGTIADVAAKRGSGAVVAVQSPGLPGVAFWSTDASGANADTTCLLSPEANPAVGVPVVASAIEVQGAFLAPSADVFVVTDAEVLGNPPPEFEPVLVPATPIEGVDLTTATPCGAK